MNDGGEEKIKVGCGDSGEGGAGGVWVGFGWMDQERWWDGDWKRLGDLPS